MIGWPRAGCWVIARGHSGSRKDHGEHLAYRWCDQLHPLQTDLSLVGLVCFQTARRGLPRARHGTKQTCSMLQSDLIFEHHDVTMEIGSTMFRMFVGPLKRPVNERKFARKSWWRGQRTMSAPAFQVAVNSPLQPPVPNLGSHLVRRAGRPYCRRVPTLRALQCRLAPRTDPHRRPDAIGTLPPIEDSEVHACDALHRSSKLNPVNRRRIEAIPHDGGKGQRTTSLIHPTPRSKGRYSASGRFAIRFASWAHTVRRRLWCQHTHGSRQISR